MKKRNIIIIVLLIIIVPILCFILFPIKLTLPSFYKIDNEKVEASIKEIKNSKEIVYTLTNKSPNTVYYGGEYSIEKASFGVWRYIIPKNEPTFKLMAYELLPNETKELTINWEYLYGKLPKGKYRIIKGLNTNQEKEDFYIAITFKIE